MSSFEVTLNVELWFVTLVTFQEHIGLVSYVLKAAIVLRSLLPFYSLNNYICFKMCFCTIGFEGMKLIGGNCWIPFSGVFDWCETWPLGERLGYLIGNYLWKNKCSASVFLQSPSMGIVFGFSCLIKSIIWLYELCSEYGSWNVSISELWSFF